MHAIPVCVCNTFFSPFSFQAIFTEWLLVIEETSPYYADMRRRHRLKYLHQNETENKPRPVALDTLDYAPTKTEAQENVRGVMEAIQRRRQDLRGLLEREAAQMGDTRRYDVDTGPTLCLRRQNAIKILTGMCGEFDQSQKHIALFKRLSGSPEGDQDTNMLRLCLVEVRE